jgi:hypothetical protein
MTTRSSPASTQVAEADADITCIAEDRLVGAENIGRFIDPTMTEREARRLLEQGHYPCWREGKVYVASKVAILAHWRQMTRSFSPPAPTRKAASRRGRIA